MKHKTPVPPNTHPESQFLYSKTYHCPVCELDFVDFAVRRTKLRITAVDTDFLTRYRDFDPNRYDVLLCSNCGYAALSGQFDNIVARQRQAILQTVTPKFTTFTFDGTPLETYDVMSRFDQAHLCAVSMEAKISQQALICLKRAWVLRVMGSSNEEEYLCKAFDGLKEAYSTERFPIGNMDETTAKLVIGDLARRTGQMGEAMRWIGEVIVAQGVQASYKDRAATIKDLVREGVRT